MTGTSFSAAVACVVVPCSSCPAVEHAAKELLNTGRVRATPGATHSGGGGRMTGPSAYLPRGRGVESWSRPPPTSCPPTPRLRAKVEFCGRPVRQRSPVLIGALSVRKVCGIGRYPPHPSACSCRWPPDAIRRHLPPDTAALERSGRIREGAALSDGPASCDREGVAGGGAYAECDCWRTRRRAHGGQERPQVALERSSLAR